MLFFLKNVNPDKKATNPIMKITANQIIRKEKPLIILFITIKTIAMSIKNIPHNLTTSDKSSFINNHIH